MIARVLIVAGSDSGGGAGIQADIKTVTALGGFATTAVTALTAQNTLGVFGVVGVAPDFIQQQMRLVLEDIGADAIKTGMLHSAAVIDAVCEVLEARAPRVPVVVDPVMVAQSGDSLLVPDAVTALTRRLVPQATVLTPNLPEAARALLELGPEAVLLKGGHLEDGATVSDVLATHAGVERFESERVATRHNHGTGCTLASAIATGLAQGLDLRTAITRARAYLLEALKSAPGLGRGHGPVNHGHTVRPFTG
jgi:hydroxymethylpyrimidine/phosphomethylpyrimidine kinase